MSVDYQQAVGLLGQVSLVRSADELPSGHVRIETPFKYPDGSSIDVFLEPRTLIDETRLSDLGQTTAWLLDLQVKPWLSKKRQAFVEDALRTYGVEQSGGELILLVPRPAELAEGVIRLAQASRAAARRRSPR